MSSLPLRRGHNHDALMMLLSALLCLARRAGQRARSQERPAAAFWMGIKTSEAWGNAVPKARHAILPLIRRMGLRSIHGLSADAVLLDTINQILKQAVTGKLPLTQQSTSADVEQWLRLILDQIVARSLEKREARRIAQERRCKATTRRRIVPSDADRADIFDWSGDYRPLPPVETVPPAINIPATGRKVGRLDSFVGFFQKSLGAFVQPAC